MIKMLWIHGINCSSQNTNKEKCKLWIRGLYTETFTARIWLNTVSVRVEIRYYTSATAIFYFWWPRWNNCLGTALLHRNIHCVIFSDVIVHFVQHCTVWKNVYGFEFCAAFFLFFFCSWDVLWLLLSPRPANPGYSLLTPPRSSDSEADCQPLTDDFRHAVCSLRWYKGLWINYPNHRHMSSSGHNSRGFVHRVVQGAATIVYGRRNSNKCILPQCGY